MTVTMTTMNFAKQKKKKELKLVLKCVWKKNRRRQEQTVFFACLMRNTHLHFNNCRLSRSDQICRPIIKPVCNSISGCFHPIFKATYYPDLLIPLSSITPRPVSSAARVLHPTSLMNHFRNHKEANVRVCSKKKKKKVGTIRWRGAKITQCQKSQRWSFSSPKAIDFFLFFCLIWPIRQ